MMDQLDQLLERLAALAAPIRLAILLGLVALVCGGYYYFFYGDLLDERAQLEATHDKDAKEKAEYEGRKKQYLAYRNEVNKLLEEQKDLLQVLPKKDDIEQFIENVNSQVEVSGLSKVSSVRGQAVSEEMYQRIPIQMSLLGGYHQINRFFKNIGELKRIVTIADLTLKAAEGKDLAAGTLRADFTAMTFQFIDRPGARPIALPPSTPGAPAAPGGATPGAPAGGGQ